ncbi:MAG: hypothetical protein K6F90_02965 [Lachnospiraceae bacterium]|nr:hypothetical protein [Lachnospiraceae bacterium]
MFCSWPFRLTPFYTYFSCSAESHSIALSRPSFENSNSFMVFLSSSVISKL